MRLEKAHLIIAGLTLVVGVLTYQSGLLDSEDMRNFSLILGGCNSVEQRIDIEPRSGQIDDR